MDRRVINGCLIVLMLVPISFTSTKTNGSDTITLQVVTTPYGGTGKDEAFSIINTTDGGFAVAGLTMSYGVDEGDFWLVKTDVNGQHEWNRTYGGIELDWAFSVFQTSDGGFALAGGTFSYGTGEADVWLVKTGANGEYEWNKTFGGADYEGWGTSLVQTSDGGFALGCGTGSYGAGIGDFWLVKTDANGTAEWNKTYGGIGNEGGWGVSLIQTSDGGFALAGDTMSYGAGSSDFWLVKTDANGTAEWNRTFGTQWDDFGISLIQTNDGGFTLAGWTESYGAGGKDMWLVKTNVSGQHEWNKTYGGFSDDWANAIIQTADGGFALAGIKEVFRPGSGGYELVASYDFWLVKTDANRVEQWNKTFGEAEYDQAYALVETSAGSFVLAGATESFGAGNRDMWLVKTETRTTTDTTTTDTTTSTTSTETINPTTQTTAGSGIPGFGALSLLVAVIALSIWYKRKK